MPPSASQLVSRRSTHRHARRVQSDAKSPQSLAPTLARELRKDSAMPLFAILVGLMSSLFAVPASAAAPRPAEAAKQRALEHFAKRQYQAGIAALEEAQRLEPHPSNEYNIAVALEKWGGRCPEALTTYRLFLEQCPECPRANTAREKILLLGSLCGAPGEASVAPAALPPQHVEGWAEVRGQDLATARQQAIAEGLRQAVEMVAGVAIAARFEDTSRSKLEGDRERFTQEVGSAVRTNSEGYVRRYEVVGDAREGRLLKVHLSVEVDATRLRSEVEQIADRIARARYPRLVLSVAERYVGERGEERATTHLETLLRRVLTEKGFEVLANDQADAADYRLTAASVTRHTGFNRRGANEHYAEAELHLSLTDLGAGTVVTEEQRTGNSPGSVFSEAQLAQRTVEHVVGDLPERMVHRLLDAWAQAERAGVRYQVVLTGMRRYEADGRQFLAAVKAVLGVTTVNERSQQGDRLVLELRYPAGVDVSTLREGILKNLSGKRDFQKVVSEAHGRTLTFRLRR